MLLEDHRIRVGRLLRGNGRNEDLDRLFIDLRMAKPGRASVREVGHFAAHRDERNIGISLDRVLDMETSARLWQRQVEGVVPDADHLREAGRANLRIIPDDRVRERFGITRQSASQMFEKALRKYGAKKPLKAREADILKSFGLSMMWQFLFDDKTLHRDFRDLLILEGSLLEAERAQFDRVLAETTLYALSTMHGARLKMAGGSIAPLHLAACDETGFLRIKADIPVGGGRKPLTTSVPMFETSLPAEKHCDPSVLGFMVDSVPVEVEGLRLVPLR